MPGSAERQAVTGTCRHRCRWEWRWSDVNDEREGHSRGDTEENPKMKFA